MRHTEIGVMVHNEVGNLNRLIGRLAGEPGWDRMVVVSSGSTDGTDAVVREWTVRDPRITLVITMFCT